MLSCVAATCSTWFFGLLVLRHFGPRARVAVMLFALAVLADVVVGRSAFELGQAFALAALLALSRRVWPAAIALALLTAASSPVAAALLALAAAVIGVSRGRALAIAVAVAAAVPVFVVAMLFPDGGYQPFATRSLIAICLVVGLVLVLVPSHERPLRLGVAAYGLACVLAYVIPNPLGSNILRLGMLFGAPLILAARQQRRSLVLAAAVVPILCLQAMPAIAAIAHANDDPSLAAGYYRPLVNYLTKVGARSTRVEIPMTLNHWESAYVAPDIALARGWERQLDVRFNDLFYRGRLTAASYRRWLLANGVRYVALPDARLDFSAREEAALIRQRPPFLTPDRVLRHWQVFRVRGARPLASGALRVVALHPASFELTAKRPGSGVVRLRYTPLWSAPPGRACITPTRAGWTRVTVRRSGNLTIGIAWDPFKSFLGVHPLGCT
jgi:hypothetical protein